MPANSEGPRPGGAPPSPTNPDDRPPKRTYMTVSAESRIRLRGIWSGPIREALAEMAAERATSDLARAA